MSIARPEYFTPLAEDEVTRLRFPLADVEVLSGDITGRRVAAVVLINGRTYQVTSAPCGAGCHCDAIAIDITDANRQPGETVDRPC